LDRNRNTVSVSFNKLAQIVHFIKHVIKRHKDEYVKKQGLPITFTARGMYVVAAEMQLFISLPPAKLNDAFSINSVILERVLSKKTIVGPITIMRMYNGRALVEYKTDKESCQFDCDMSSAVEFLSGASNDTDD
jgi:hypothetical protein